MDYLLPAALQSGWWNRTIAVTEDTGAITGPGKWLLHSGSSAYVYGMLPCLPVLYSHESVPIDPAKAHRNYRKTPALTPFVPSMLVTATQHRLRNS